jgi:hypothetical protein
VESGDRQEADLVIKMGRPTLNLDVGQIRIGAEAAVVAGNAEEIKRIANPKVDIFSQRLSPAHRCHVWKAQRTNRSKPGDVFRQQRHPGPAIRLHRRLRRARGQTPRLGQEIPTSWFLQDIRD